MPCSSPALCVRRLLPLQITAEVKSAMTALPGDGKLLGNWATAPTGAPSGASAGASAGGGFMGGFRY